MSDLEKFVPAAVKLEVRGETLEVTPVRVKELPAFARAVHPLLPHIAPDSESQLSWADLMTLYSDSLIDAVALGIRKPRAWVEEMEVDELVAAVGAVATVNVDFFVRRLLPRVTETAAEVTKTLGQMRSTGSPGADTASAT